MKFKYKGINIYFTTKAYIPSDDSFLLAEAALSEIKSGNILEIGCGSGIISAVIKANTNANIIGIDINPYAVKSTKKNGVEVIRGDLLSCIKGKFDVILFNPPYLPISEKEKDESWLTKAIDGGKDGREVIFRFIKQADNHLTKNGKIIILVSSITGINEVISKFESLKYSVKEKMSKKIMFEKLTVLIATRKY